MSSKLNRITTRNWTSYQVLGFKFLTIFFALLIIPLDYKFYAYLFSGDWLDFQITSILKIVGYLPSFFHEVDNESYSGVSAFSSWGLAFVLSLAGVIIWNTLERKGNKLLADYDRIYYWLRVVLRYKLALILIAYGAIKIFPLQFPFPSLSNLYTNYGDFLPWKIWYHTLGVTPNYLAFLGAVEILAALLLLSRKTVTFGAALVIGVEINVVLSVFSYHMGNQVLITFVFLMAFFIFSNDLPRIFSLLFLEKPTKGETFSPRYSFHTKLISQALFAVLAAVVFLSALFNYKTDPYLTPHNPGLEGAYGFYNVKEFVLNHDTIPYSRTDTNRWQNVIFEKWATLSIKTAKPVIADSTFYLDKKLDDTARVYESAGLDGRRYFSYNIDSANSLLSLENKNAHYTFEKFKLVFNRPDEKTLIVSGVNEKNDSIHAVLERNDRKFILIESRRFPIQL